MRLSKLAGKQLSRVSWALIAAASFPSLTLAAEPPPDIANFLDRVERCERAARLESYEPARRDQIHQTYHNLGCRNLIRDEAALRVQYSDDATALDALDAAKHAH